MLLLWLKLLCIGIMLLLIQICLCLYFLCDSVTMLLLFLILHWWFMHCMYYWLYYTVLIFYLWKLIPNMLHTFDFVCWQLARAVWFFARYIELLYVISYANSKYMCYMLCVYFDWIENICVGRSYGVWRVCFSHCHLVFGVMPRTIHCVALHHCIQTHFFCCVTFFYVNFCVTVLLFVTLTFLLLRYF